LERQGRRVHRASLDLKVLPEILVLQGQSGQKAQMVHKVQWGWLVLRGRKVQRVQRGQVEALLVRRERQEQRDQKVQSVLRDLQVQMG
jgi:hypothetical protein